MDEKESLDRNEKTTGMGAATRLVSEPTLLSALEESRNVLIKRLAETNSLIEELKQNPHHEEIVKKYRGCYF